MGLKNKIELLITPSVTNSSKHTDLPFLEHLAELRRSLLKVSLALTIGFLISLYFSEEIYTWLAKPLTDLLPSNTKFITTHPFEAWLTLFKTAFFSSIFLSFPFIFWSVWQFIAPGLFSNERRVSLIVVTIGSLLFVTGSLFGYQVVFPVMFSYFVDVTQDAGVQFLPQMKDYLTFTFKMLLTFGVIFELPFLVLALSLTGLVSFEKLFAFQRYMVVISFFIAAVLTPPDVISQIIMGIPILMLYELGLLAAWFFNRKTKNQTS